MNRLEIAFINVFSPYKVWNRGDVLYFETDKDISTYKLVYSEYNSEYKDENRKCNFSLK